MTNLKTYKDGSRLILVVENCTGEIAAKVNAFVLDLLGTNGPEVIPAVVPITVQEEAEPEVRPEQEITKENGNLFNAPAPEETAKNIPVDGPSGTLGNAINTGDTNTVVRVCVKATNLDESLRHTVIKLCKEYLLDDCSRRNPDNAGVHDFKSFCETYKPLIDKSLKNILSQAGHNKLHHFIAEAKLEVLRDAYSRLLDDLIVRMRK